MESRSTAAAVQESPNGVAARLEAELQRTLAAEADELRAERDAEEQVTLAEAVVRERVEWAIAEAREEMSRSAGEPLGAEARLRLVEARSEIAASRNGARNAVGDLAERLLDRLSRIWTAIAPRRPTNWAPGSTAGWTSFEPAPTPPRSG